MNKLWLLVKNNLITTLGINKLARSSKSKIILYSLFALYMLFSIFTVSVQYSHSILNYLKPYQLTNYMLILLFVMGSFAVFMLNIYNSKSNLFSAKDNDLLLSMPLKPQTILASRIISLWFWNLISLILFVGPAIIVYALEMKPSVSYYPMVSIIFLLLPIIPTILASLIGYVIAYFTAHSKSKNWFELVITFIFVFGIYYLMGNGQSILSYFVKDIELLNKILKYGFYPIYLINQALNSTDYLSLVSYIIINIGLLAIVVILLSHNYHKIIVKLGENRTKSNYVMKKLKVGSINKTLLNKEIKRFFASPIYVLNTTFGVVLIIVLAIATFFVDQHKLLAMMNVNIGVASNFELVLVLSLFVVFISNTAATSISLEGSNFWILKTLPINPKQVFNSKVLLNMIMVLPLTIIASILLKITMALSLLQLLVVIITLILASLVTAQFGLLINLKFPKLDAVSDVAVVKRSASAMIAVFVPMIAIFSFAGVYGELSKGVSTNILILIGELLLIILIIIERMLLNYWGVKQFKQIG